MLLFASFFPSLFFAILIHCFCIKKKNPYLTPRKFPGSIIQSSLWLPGGPRWNDLFCFASLVPSVVWADLSVPEHGNVIVARGDWRRYRPSLWLDPRHHPVFVRDPHDTFTLAWLFLLIIQTSLWSDRSHLHRQLYLVCLNWISSYI